MQCFYNLKGCYEGIELPQKTDQRVIDLKKCLFDLCYPLFGGFLKGMQRSDPELVFQKTYQFLKSLPKGMEKLLLVHLKMGKMRKPSLKK
jgi:hypothetical protein